VQVRTSLLLVGFLASAVAGAQTVQIQADNAKRLGVFARNGAPTDVSSNVQFSVGPKTSFELSPTDSVVGEQPIGPSSTLYVWNLATGNVAAKPVSAVGKQWHVSPQEFNRICHVTVRVEYKDDPVAAARVVLKDKTHEQSQLLDADSKGEADFYLVSPGTVTVTVEYRSGGSAAQPLVQQFPLDLQRKTPDPLLTVSLPYKVETVNPAKTGDAPTQQVPSTPAKPVAHNNPIGSALIFLFTLALAIGLAWGLYQLAKKNPDWMHGKLKQLGVDVPDTPHHVADDSNTPTPDLIPAKPVAQSKIILDDAGLPPAPAAPMPGQLIQHEPRLVKANGQVVNLAEGEMVVGRDENLGLSLVGESSVSRRHASITRQGNALTLKDLGSTNGTYVNGRRIDAETRLSPGDDVQFGAVKFRVEGK
jgi:hypothetical protein